MIAKRSKPCLGSRAGVIYFHHKPNTSWKRKIVRLVPDLCWWRMDCHGGKPFPTIEKLTELYHSPRNFSGLVSELCIKKSN